MQVLRVRGAYGNRDCPHIETTVESANEINSWGKMSATWSPVLTLPFSRSRLPILSAFLCNSAHVRTLDTAPFELSRVKMT